MIHQSTKESARKASRRRRRALRKGDYLVFSVIQVDDAVYEKKPCIWSNGEMVLRVQSIADDWLSLAPIDHGPVTCVRWCPTRRDWRMDLYAYVPVRSTQAVRYVRILSFRRATALDIENYLKGRLADLRNARQRAASAEKSYRQYIKEKLPT